jgi:hypothetical protein
MRGIPYTIDDDRKDDFGAYAFTNPVDTNENLKKTHENNRFNLRYRYYGIQYAKMTIKGTFNENT